MILTGNSDRSVWVENLGDAKFKVHELPTLAQIAPMNGMVAEDVNGDGLTDLMMVGNDYGNEIFIGRLDASVGLILLGDGKGKFRPATPLESGFIVPGDAKALVKLSNPDGSPIYFASQNRGKLLAFRPTANLTQSIVPPLEAMAILLELENGKFQRVDATLGAGFGSQSSRAIGIPAGVKSAVMITYKGEMIPLTIFGME